RFAYCLKEGRVVLRRANADADELGEGSLIPANEDVAGRERGGDGFLTVRWEAEEDEVRGGVEGLDAGQGVQVLLELVAFPVEEGNLLHELVDVLERSDGDRRGDAADVVEGRGRAANP